MIRIFLGIALTSAITASVMLNIFTYTDCFSRHADFKTPTELADNQAFQNMVKHINQLPVRGMK